MLQKHGEQRVGGCDHAAHKRHQQMASSLRCRLFRCVFDAVDGVKGHGDEDPFYKTVANIILFWIVALKRPFLRSYGVKICFRISAKMHLSPLPNWQKLELVEDGVKSRVWMHRGTKRLSFLRPDQDKTAPLVTPPMTARKAFKKTHPELKKTDLTAAYAAASTEEKKACDALAAADTARFVEDAVKVFGRKPAADPTEIPTTEGEASPGHRDLEVASPAEGATTVMEEAPVVEEGAVVEEAAAALAPVEETLEDAVAAALDAVTSPALTSDGL